jgi:beta-lactamase class A
MLNFLSRPLFFAFVILCVCAASARGQGAPPNPPQESPARADVEKLIQTYSADTSVAFRTLDGTQELFIDADKPFRSSSAIKIVVMIELYAEAEAGELRLSDSLLVTPAPQNDAHPGTPHADAKDAKNDPTYESIGKTLTLRELCEAMIVRGSLRAESLLIERLDAARIRNRLHELGADGVKFVAPVESDTGLAAEGPQNTETARDLMVLLWALAKGQAVSPDASQEMMGMLARSIPYQGIAAGLPGSQDAALGTAGFAENHQEAAIVYGPHSFVIVIVIRDVQDRTASFALSAQLTHALSVPVW